LKSYTSLNQIREDIKSGQITCRKLVESYLENIEKYRKLNAFLEVFSEQALKQASEIDFKIASGKAGKLAGMVLSIKDLLCLKDHKVQASSRILEGFESQFTGTALQRLLDEDAIIIGRTNWPYLERDPKRSCTGRFIRRGCSIGADEYVPCRFGFRYGRLCSPASCFLWGDRAKTHLFQNLEAWIDRICFFI
jgi:hypothetical protein